MKILVLNAGSSSLKIQIFKANKNFKSIYKGLVERIGKSRIRNHEQALKILLEDALKKKSIKNLSEIQAIGHRVVHGGEKYVKAVKITPAVVDKIKELINLAPLHNPPNLAGILACKKLLAKIPQVAVFDTSFHQTMEEKAYIYPLPYRYYEKDDIRKYGFHGTSHSYISKETIKLLKKKNSKIITCHLGNGSSITAVKDGKSIDTSMGYTPLEGLPMGTRCGDIDPAIVIWLSEKKKKTPAQIYKILNNESGLRGISQLSRDMRDLHKASSSNKKARLAISILAYRTAKYIAAYSAALQGLDAITFTAGLGENAYYLRQEICNYLAYLGIKLDPVKNRKNALKISSKGSKVRVFVIPTNEELEIANETYKTLH
jgi:acetate kinase